MQVFVPAERRWHGFPQGVPAEFVFVVITAAREVETVRTAMAGGVLHYLIKPFTPDALKGKLELLGLVIRESV